MLLTAGAAALIVGAVVAFVVLATPRAGDRPDATPVVVPQAAPAPALAAEPGPGLPGLVDREWAQKISDATGIPVTAVVAYAGGALGAEWNFPECGISWNTLAAIGLVESDHGRHDGSAVGDDGVVRPPIYGVALNGDGVVLIPDTDGGELDGDAEHDRAVGPMQIIPQTWRSWVFDAEGDGTTDPQNFYDAAVAAGDYLCHASGGMSTDEGWLSAIASYNAGDVYLRDVAEAAQRYADAEASVTG